jgi:hypothetical protein
LVAEGAFSAYGRIDALTSFWGSKMRVFRALVRLVAVAGCVSVLGVALPAVAAASFSSVPTSTWVTDGHVDAVAVANGHIFLGGAFSQVGPNTGNGVAFDTSSQAIDPAFAQFNGPVDVSIPDGAGGFFVGGSFTNVGGQAHAGVVHLLSGGGVDPSFNAAVSGGNDQVLALALADGKLFVGGWFDHVDGEAHSNLGAVSASTGAVDSGFDVNPGSVVQALVASGGASPRVYAAGDWSSVNGVSGHNGIVSIDPSSDQLDPNFNATVPGATVYALALNGSLLYLGGNFGSVDGSSRDTLAAVSQSDGSLDAFAPSGLTGAGTIRSLAVVGERLFVGGAFEDQGVSPQLVNLAAFDLSQSGTPVDQAFAPNPDREVDSLAAVGSTLYAGGQFLNVAGQGRQRLAAIDANPSDGVAYGTISAFNPLPDDTVQTLSVSGSRLFAGGNFGIVGGIHRYNVAALNVSGGTADPGFTANTDAGGAYYGANGGEVHALAVQGTTLYLGGNFGHVNSQLKPYLAAVSSTDGTVVGGFSPSPDNAVDGLVSSDSRLYASGSFQNIGGTAQTGVASLYLDTGLADPAFSVTGAGQPVNAIALGGGNLYIAGSFSSLDGVARPGLAAVSPATGALNTAFSPPAQAGYQDYSLAAGSSLVYAGYNGGGSPPRNGAAAFNSSDGSLNAGWNATFNPTDDVHAMVLDGSQLILGGGFGSVNGHSHASLVAVDATTGADDQSFDPSIGASPVGGPPVLGLASDGTNVYVGGQFTTVNGLPQSNFAEFATGAPQGAPVNDSPPSISGTAQEDQTLVADPGAWTGSPTSYSYEWRDCDPSGFSCTDISGATNPDYTLTSTDVGHTIVVRTTATNAAGTSQPAVSPHTDAVSTATSASVPTVTTGASGSVGSDTATVNATIDGQGEQTTYWFIYGTDGTTFPDSTPRYSLGNASGAQSVAGVLSALAASTTYYYEVVAQNASGTATGSPQQLTTAAAPTGGGGSGATPTGTAVSCSPSSVATGSSTLCTATVTNTASGSSAPAGTVLFSADGTGAFSASGCSLGATSSSSSNCSVSFTPDAVGSGSRNITGSYPGDASHSASSGSGALAVTPGAPAGLTVATGGVNRITATGATVSGLVNPAGADATYFFQYGPDSNYGSQTAAADAGTVNGFIGLADLAGLSPNTAYHYRIVAQQGAGTPVYGADRTFLTLGPPTVTPGAAVGVSQTGATLTGAINPLGSDTHYHFEYGTTPAYGTSVPAGNEPDLGATDESEHNVTYDIPSGTLTPGTTYHFRLVADDQYGTTYGGDNTFTTQPPPPPPPTIESETANLNGRVLQFVATVDLHGLPGTYHFVWGVGTTYGSPNYTNQTPETPVPTDPANGPVKVRASVSPTQGSSVNYAVFVTTQSGTSAPENWNIAGQQDSIGVDGPGPTATTGTVSDNGNGSLTATGVISPNGYNVGYHFQVTQFQCGGGQGFDTPEQQLASGGDYTPVNVSGPATVEPGTTVSVQLVVDWATSGYVPESAQASAVTLRASGAANSGDFASVGDVTTTGANVTVILVPTSSLAAWLTPSAPSSSGGGGWGSGWGFSGAPLQPEVALNYGLDQNYGSLTDPVAWGNGGTPACPFVNLYSLGGLSAGTTYHTQVQTGVLTDSSTCTGGGLGCWGASTETIFAPEASGPDFTFTTAAGDALGGLVWSPESNTVGQEVACTAGTSCAGSMSYVIGVVNKGHARIASVRKVVLATVRFRLPAHSRRLITVRLSRPTVRMLARLHVVRVTEVLTMRAGAGRPVTTHRTVALRPAKPTRRTKHRH